MISRIPNEENRLKSLEVFRKGPGHRPDSGCRIAKRTGVSTLHAITLDKGLYVHIWDVVFANRVTQTHPVEEICDPEFFALVYYLTPDAVDLNHKSEKNIRINKLWNTVFFSSNAAFNPDIHARNPFQCVRICFSPEWISTRISDSRQREFIHKILCSSHPTFFFESYNRLEEKMLNYIFKSGDARGVGALFIKSIVLTLVCEFIGKASRRQSLLAPSHADMHEEPIRLIESRLIQCLDTKMPSLKELAHEYALSESTLKRNFKKKYGKSINDYYLEKKMVYAKELIRKENKTITETAYLLGYEKVSHFSSMFKKHIGCLPGSLRHRASQKK